MVKIYRFSDLHTIDKNTVDSITIVGEKLTNDDLIYIFTFTNIQRLCLALNDIDEIPTEISNLTNLICLAINFNNITGLPYSIKELKLISLDISSNNISVLQDEIFEIDTLQKLYINNNIIAAIPSAIYKLCNLRIIQFGNIEPCVSMPYIINNKLIEIDISNHKYINNGNKIESLPNEFAYLQYLVKIIDDDINVNDVLCDDNMIIFKFNKDTHIPDTVKNLVIMIDTNPDNNLLDNLPYEIKRLSLIQVKSNMTLKNLPNSLTQLYFYTSPYCELFKPYSHWKSEMTKEEIRKLSIPFGCSVFLNDDDFEL